MFDKVILVKCDDRFLSGSASYWLSKLFHNLQWEFYWNESQDQSYFSCIAFRRKTKFPGICVLWMKRKNTTRMQLLKLLFCWFIGSVFTRNLVVLILILILQLVSSHKEESSMPETDQKQQYLIHLLANTCA